MELSREDLLRMVRDAARGALEEKLAGLAPKEPPAAELAKRVRELVQKGVTSGETPFLPSGVAREIIRAAERGATVRPHATVRTVAESTGRVPVARPNLSAHWVPEAGEPPSESEPGFTYIPWSAKKLKAYTKVTVEALEDNLVDLGAEIAESLGRAIRYTEETAFWLGDGTDRPLGIDQTVPASHTYDGTGVDLLDMVNTLYMALPVEFRESAAWYMNSTTKAMLLGLKDSTGRPLLVPNPAGGFPWSLYGRPVREAWVLPDGTAFFGDMGFYFIFQRSQVELRVVTEDQSLALADEVLITVTERLDGRLAWDEEGGITPFVKGVNLGQ